MKGLYAIADHGALLARSLDVVSFAAAVLEAGPAALQVRAKDAAPRDVLGLLRALAPMCRRKGVPLVVNDRVDLATLGAADWLHVGQGDATPSQIRGLSKALRFGVSTHDLDQLARALDESPAYVAFGPVFETRSKERPDPVVGLDGLLAASALVRARTPRVPLVAIGGITLERAASVARLADMGAVIADLLPPRDLGEVDALDWVKQRARALQAALSGPAAPTEVRV